MKLICILFLSLSLSGVHAQDHSHIEEIEAFQSELNESYKDPESSPLEGKALRKFKGHKFFPIEESFRIEATFERTEGEVPFQMKTTTDRLPIYEKYGEVTFYIDERLYRLNVYQSHRLRETETYKTYLFLPFTDRTNGVDSYGGGRYIDLSIPDSNEIVIDFNKAYAPYCAYNHNRSCPIPPEENNLDLEVRAGVMYTHK